MTTPVHLGIAAVANPLEVGAGDAPSLQQRLERALPGIQPARMNLLSFARPVTDPLSSVAAGRFFYDARVDAICIIAASWFEDYLVLDLLEECAVPVIIWARPGMETGSLCGVQQLSYLLKALGKPCCVLFDPPEAQQSLQRARDYALACAVRNQLRRARLGFLGHRVEGMTETTGHELALKKQFGPRIVGLDMPTFLQRAVTIPVDAACRYWEDVQGRVGRVNVRDEAGRESLQVYLALKELISEHGLDALTVGCYPDLMGKVCLAASLLGEEGIPLACEGDINGALGMSLLTRLSGKPVHNTDLLDPVVEHNSIIFAHCGSGAFSLAESPADITLGPVRLLNRGLCCLFTARPGPVTLVNLVPTMGGYRLGVLYGQALSTTMVFPGNPLEVQFISSYGEVLSWIIDHGLGHHWMAAYGDLRPVLADLAGMTGLEWTSMA